MEASGVDPADLQVVQLDSAATIEAGTPEIRIVFDQERVSQLGLAVRDVADRVVGSIRGEVATRWQWRDKKIDVRVRSLDTHAASIDAAS